MPPRFTPLSSLRNCTSYFISSLMIASSPPLLLHYLTFLYIFLVSSYIIFSAILLHFIPITHLGMEKSKYDYQYDAYRSYHFQSYFQDAIGIYCFWYPYIAEQEFPKKVILGNGSNLIIKFEDIKFNHYGAFSNTPRIHIGSQKNR